VPVPWPAVTDTQDRGRLGTVLATLLAPILWGTTFITVTEFLPPGRPLLVAAARVVPAGIALLALGALSPGWRPDSWRRTLVLSLCYYGLFFPFLIVAVYRLPGGVAAATSGVQPLMVALIALIVSGARATRIDIVVGIVAAIGVTMVVIQPDAGFDVIGVSAGLAAQACFSAGVVLTKKYPTPPNRLADTGWQMVIAGVILVPLVLIFEGLPESITATNLVAFAYLSLVVTGAAFLLWMNGVRKLPPTAPPLLNAAVPVTATILGWVILDQTMSPIQLIGLIVAFGTISYGAVIGARSGRAAPS